MIHNLTGADRSSRLRIIVLGYVIRGPLGGMVWSNLQYLMGLAGLGHDVYFIEDSDDYPSCYDPQKGYTDVDPAYGLRFAAMTFARIGFGDRWAYHDAHGTGWHGPAANRILDLCRSADLLLNLCGVNPLRSWFLDIPRRALIDEDPAFTQIKHLTNPAARDKAARHTGFFSFGENIAAGRSLVPDDYFAWQETRQPISFDSWPPTPGPLEGSFTTVMQWSSYAACEYQGCRYGMKADSFTPYLDLPRKVGPIFEVAVGGESAQDRLGSRQWRIRDPFEISRDPWTYEAFIRNSKAEFSVAKHGYVVSRSGWFSERSVAYLAAGRPVIVQETGFSDWLPTGSGVLSFNTPGEAQAAIEEVHRRYGFHCKTARLIAEEYFDARKVLASLVARAMDGAAVPTPPARVSKDNAAPA